MLVAIAQISRSILVRCLEVTRLSVAASVSSSDGGKFRSKVAAYCGCTRFGFVSGDMGDRLDVVACPAVALVGWTEAGKITPAIVVFFWRESSGLFFGEGELLWRWL